MDDLLCDPDLRDNLDKQVIKGRNTDILDQVTDSSNIFHNY